MSGIGKRFIDAGYQDPKPLIKVDGKPIIEHVCNLFPGETKFSFICNAKHLTETNMRDVLSEINPNGNILEIPNHKKGPVYAVQLIEEIIDDEEEIIINYCDFGTYWDYKDFLKHTRERDADGAIPSYKGFHPHMLGSTNYAFMRDKEQWMLEIKEKEPFTDDRTEHKDQQNKTPEVALSERKRKPVKMVSQLCSACNTTFEVHPTHKRDFFTCDKCLKSRSV